jgi:hypothetical protein
VPIANPPEGMPDRRRSVRVDLLADLEGHLVTLDERIQIRQISLGGMTVETTAPLSPRLEHEFRLTIGDRAVTVAARVVHSRVAVQGDVVTFLAGVQFVGPSPEALGLIHEFIGQLSAEGAR